MFNLFNLLKRKIRILIYIFILIKIAGISVENQTFAIANSAYGMNGNANDGVLGMAYPNHAISGANPVVWSMYYAGKLQNPIFSFWFNA